MNAVLEENLPWNTPESQLKQVHCSNSLVLFFYLPYLNPTLLDTKINEMRDIRSSSLYVQNYVPIVQVWVSVR